MREHGPGDEEGLLEIVEGEVEVVELQLHVPLLRVQRVLRAAPVQVDGPENEFAVLYGFAD